MDKKEEKKMKNKDLEQKQLNLEKDFHKTYFGKLMKILASLGITEIIVGLFILFLFYTFKLNNDTFEVAVRLLRSGGVLTFACAILYGIILPLLPKINKEEKDSKNK